MALICDKCGVINMGFSKRYKPYTEYNLNCEHAWLDLDTEPSKDEEPKMTVKFIFEEDGQNEILTFGIVEDNQLFISHSGYLWMKRSHVDAIRIAYPDGGPCPDLMVWDHYERIKKIFPPLTKIEF